MDFVTNYGGLIKKTAATHPDRALSMIKLGLMYEQRRTKNFPDKKTPKAYQQLNHLAVKSVYDALRDPSHSAWANIFAPVELLHCFGLKPLSLECFSSFMAGFQIEDLLIDTAEKSGLAETLCGYHKAFIGGGELQLLPPPPIAITTSTICDGNVQTFKYMCEEKKVPLYIIDVPTESSKESLQYVESQLRELINMLEDITHMKYDETQLRASLTRENASKAYYHDFLLQQTQHYYPSTLSLQLFMLFASHLSIGTKESLDFYKFLAEDVKHYPAREGLRFFWVHLMPYHHKVLGSYFNYNPHYQIVSYDLNMDYMTPLDLEAPLTALARKLTDNLFNGSYQRKADFVAKMTKSLNCDAAIHFCHWGCKQSSGGVHLLKETLAKEGIPTLILDGDALDRRSSQDGQIQTRLEAFIEMIEKQKGGEQIDRLCL